VHPEVPKEPLARISFVILIVLITGFDI